jgi:hypothetical protein
METMSEYDRQMAIFKAKVKTPDQTIRAYSVLRVTGRQLGDDKYWFLTDDDQVILVDMTDELPEVATGPTPVRAAGIKIDQLTDADVGRWVRYRSWGGDKVELGRIKSWNDSGIFVVYNEPARLDGWQNYTAAHTDAQDLEFTDGTE